jgi:hypothetical protein
VTRGAALILCGVAVAALVVVLSASEPENTIAKAISAALMLILFTPIGLTGVVLAARRPALSWFGYATVAVAFATFVLLTKEVWDGSGIFFFFGDSKFAGIALVVALACGQVSLLLAWARSGSLVRGLGFAATFVIVAIAVLAVLEILADIEISDRIYGVLAILYLLPVTLLPLFTLGGSETNDTPDP